MRSTLEGGQKMYTHSPDLCRGEVCCIHNRTQHHMREWPQNWRQDRQLMERICPHGVGHPDPDHLTYLERTFGVERRNLEASHRCDGCCAPRSEETATPDKAHEACIAMAAWWDGIPGQMKNDDPRWQAATAVRLAREAIKAWRINQMSIW